MRAINVDALFCTSFRFFYFLHIQEILTKKINYIKIDGAKNWFEKFKTARRYKKNYNALLHSSGSGTLVIQWTKISYPCDLPRDPLTFSVVFSLNPINSQCFLFVCIRWCPMPRNEQYYFDISFFRACKEECSDFSEPNTSAKLAAKRSSVRREPGTINNIANDLNSRLKIILVHISNISLFHSSEFTKWEIYFSGDRIEFERKNIKNSVNLFLERST